MNQFTNKVLLLPLLGFPVAGCSTSSNLQTSETDDVYFSSKDKVTYVEPTYEERSNQGAYADDNASSEDISERVSDPETYADDRRTRRNDDPYQYSYYDAPFGNPYYAYSPYYSPSRYYSRAAMYDPWYDPFYDPFYRPVVVYDPFWPRPMYSGVMISIGLGWGNPWGYGYGYSPYRYGYYNPYRYGGYYDGYYRGDVYARKVNYGPRHDRSSNAGSAAASRVGIRDSRGSAVAPNSRSRSASTAPDGVIRSSRSSDASSYPATRRTTTRQSEDVQPVNRSRSSEVQQERPVRRRESAPATQDQTETRSRERTQSRSSYEPSRSSEPTRSYEPSRSSSSSSGNSGSSSGGSSSGSSRRGRN